MTGSQGDLGKLGFSGVVCAAKALKVPWLALKPSSRAVCLFYSPSSLKIHFPKLISLIFLNLLHFASQIPIFSMKIVLITINYQSEIIIIVTIFMGVVSLLSLCVGQQVFQLSCYTPALPKS